MRLVTRIFVAMVQQALHRYVRLHKRYTSRKLPGSEFGIIHLSYATLPGFNDIINDVHEAWFIHLSR